jgi:negative regulator of sigma E activity
MTGWMGATAGLLLVACAGAQSPRKTAAAAPQDKNLICEETPVTGSHLPRRVCRSAEQVKQEREQAQKERREANRTETGNTP